MKRAIVSISYDGIITHYCGVGTIVKAMNKSINKINKTLNNKIDYYLISSAYNKKCLGYSKTLKPLSDLYSYEPK